MSLVCRCAFDGKCIMGVCHGSRKLRPGDKCPPVATSGPETTVTRLLAKRIFLPPPPPSYATARSHLAAWCTDSKLASCTTCGVSYNLPMIQK